MELKETRSEIYDGLLEYYFKRYEEEAVKHNLPILTEDYKYRLREHYNDYIFNNLIDFDGEPTEVWTFELLGKGFLIIEETIEKDIKIRLRNNPK